MPSCSYADLNIPLWLLMGLSLSTVLQPLGVVGRTIGTIQQQNQLPGNTTDPAGEGKDIRRLEIGDRIWRDLAGGQQHTYQVRLSTEQFLKVVVEQNGIDIVVQLSGPDAKRILKFDSE